MASFNRRIFLTRTSLAAAGVAVAPSLPGVVGVAENDTATVDGAATDLASTTLEQPLVAHVRDVTTGEIGLFNGTSHVVTYDPQLAARLVRAAR